MGEGHDSSDNYEEYETEEEQLRRYEREKNKYNLSYEDEKEMDQDFGLGGW